MKALTLHQPWASLVALRRKTVETRSWATKHRGPIAIHAGVKRPRLAKWKPGEPGPADLAVHEVADPAHSNGQKLCYCGWDAKTCLRQGLSSLPLGAVVATANLVDCVPIINGVDDEPEGPFVYADLGNFLQVHDGPNDTVPFYNDWDIHLGDFRPGRWAWLLDDVKPTTERCPSCWGEDGVICFRCMGIRRCDPIPAKGRQGLWTWNPGDAR